MTKVDIRKITEGRKTEIIVALAVIIWTVWHSFLGIDMVDTGYYYYQYLYPRAWNIPYTGYLATLIGAVWIRVFPFLGLWGLNILELFLEYVLCWVVYRTFRDQFNRKRLVIAIAFCMLCISTYVNAFNYHQLSMFFCALMLCAMYCGQKRNQQMWLFCSGVCGGLAIASRMPSVLTLCCIACIVYWRVFVERDWKRLAKEVLLFLAGYAAVAVVYAVVLWQLDVLDIVLGEITRLGKLGGSSSAAYGVSGQFSNLIWDAIHSLEAVVVFGLCGVGLTLAMEPVCRFVRGEHFKWKQAVMSAVLMCAAGILYLYWAHQAVYEIGQAPNFIQLSSFSWFIYGFFLLFGVIETLRGMICREKSAKIEGALAFMGLALMFLCFVGSAARAKHAILGLWILAPLMLERVVFWLSKVDAIEVKKWVKLRISKPAIQLSSCVVILSLIAVFGNFLMDTNNFDSTNRLELTAEIDNEKLVFLKTTQRQADAVNEVLQVIEQNKKEDGSMMVIGNTIMLYALTEIQAYVKPWVSGTSYTVTDLEEGIKREEKSGRPLPIIVRAKTNSYEGYALEDYKRLLNEMDKSYRKAAKTKIIESFMERHAYETVFENDYFIVSMPELKKEGKKK